MKVTEIEDLAELHRFLAQSCRNWENVVLQSLDLREDDARLAQEPLRRTTAFVGCTLGRELAPVAVAAGCMLLAPRPDLPFNPYRPAVYDWRVLMDRYRPDTPDSYRDCLDWKCYEAAMDENTKKRRADLTLADELTFRLHDFSQEDALQDYLRPVVADASTWKKVVAIMGGHDLERQEKKRDEKGKLTPEDAPYMSAALLGWKLTRLGYVVATGGGPGAMEAGNLGAFLAGRPEEELRSAVRRLEAVPKIEPITQGSPRWNSGEWLAPAVRIVEEFQAANLGSPGESIGIPTWFYGHEPPNVFATRIAKYFENSLREEGLLAIATHGVIFTRGNAGTVQEIFQDACQNYYSTYGPPAPMVLLESAYWNRPAFGPAGAKDKPAWPLLQQLASERAKDGFPRVILLADSIEEAVQHIQSLDTDTQPV